MEVKWGVRGIHTSLSGQKCVLCWRKASSGEVCNAKGSSWASEISGRAKISGGTQFPDFRQRKGLNIYKKICQWLTSSSVSSYFKFEIDLDILLKINLKSLIGEKIICICKHSNITSTLLKIQYDRLWSLCPGWAFRSFMRRVHGTFRVDLKEENLSFIQQVFMEHHLCIQYQPRIWQHIWSRTGMLLTSPKYQSSSSHLSQFR